MFGCPSKWEKERTLSFLAYWLDALWQRDGKTDAITDYRPKDRLNESFVTKMVEG